MATERCERCSGTGLKLLGVHPAGLLVGKDECPDCNGTGRVEVKG